LPDALQIRVLQYILKTVSNSRRKVQIRREIFIILSNNLPSYPVKTGVKAGLFNALIKAAKDKRNAGKFAVA